MKTLASAMALALLLPLGGCVAPYYGYSGYGSSGGAWANYDPEYDLGYGYDRPVNYAPDGIFGPPAYGPPTSANYPVVPYSYGSYGAPSYASAYAPSYSYGYGGSAYYYPAPYGTYYQGPGYGGY